MTPIAKAVCVLVIGVVMLLPVTLTKSTSMESNGSDIKWLTLKVAKLERLWMEERNQWKKEKNMLKSQINELKVRCSPCSKNVEQALPSSGTNEGSTINISDTQTRDHLLTIRSDDANELEPVIGQMTQRLTKMEADMAALKNDNQRQDTAIQVAASSTYVRWGNSHCPASAELIYSGVVGGSGEYTSPGAPTSVFCLPLNPVFSSHAHPPHFAEMHGAEYQTYDSHNDRDPVCAVCRVHRPTTIMLPATNVCKTGWTLEYRGHLMGSDDIYNAGHESVCMDEAMEERSESQQDLPGILFFYTMYRCGSLPCPAYQQDKLATCAVCSK